MKGGIEAASVRKCVKERRADGYLCRAVDDRAFIPLYERWPQSQNGAGVGTTLHPRVAYCGWGGGTVLKDKAHVDGHLKSQLVY